MSNLKIYGPFKELLTLESLPLKGPIRDDELEIKQHHAILVEGELIREIGSYSAILNRYPEAEVIWKDEVLRVVLPAFVD